MAPQKILHLISFQPHPFCDVLIRLIALQSIHTLLNAYKYYYLMATKKVSG
jgi:hypothetical protein